MIFIAIFNFITHSFLKLCPWDEKASETAKNPKTHHELFLKQSFFLEVKECFAFALCSIFFGDIVCGIKAY